MKEAILTQVRWCLLIRTLNASLFPARASATNSESLYEQLFLLSSGIAIFLPLSNPLEDCETKEGIP
jgi:hypothetical protein